MGDTRSLRSLCGFGEFSIGFRDFARDLRVFWRISDKLQEVQGVFRKFQRIFSRLQKLYKLQVITGVIGDFSRVLRLFGTFWRVAGTLQGVSRRYLWRYLRRFRRMFNRILRSFSSIF